MKSRFIIIKWIIAALAVGNLIFLFIFDYQLPGFLKFSSNSPTSGESASIITPADTDTEEDTSKESSISIQLPEEPLQFDGSQNLDLMQDVAILNADGSVRTDIKMFSTINSGNSQKEKIIQYSATDENGIRVTASRELILPDSYTGPFIEIKGDMPQLPADDLSVLVSVLIDKNLLYAEDGFGKDVTSAVTSSISAPADEAGNTVVTLTLTNMVNDSVSVDVTIYTGSATGPRITLTKYTETLNVGDDFSFYNYIESAKDANGNDLYHRINVEGSVNTHEAGTYTLDFFCVDEDGNRSNVETLTVIVQ